MARVDIAKGLFFATALAWVANTTVNADERRFDRYTIHYNAFSADVLSPQVAKTYGIQRSKNRGVLNVSVTETPAAGGLPTPVEADIEVRAVNVYQQMKPIKLRKVTEGDAIYYLAEFPVANQEMVHFEVRVQRSTNDIGSVKFQKQFFTD